MVIFWSDKIKEPWVTGDGEVMYDQTEKKNGSHVLSDSTNGVFYDTDLVLATNDSK